MSGATEQQSSQPLALQANQPAGAGVAPAASQASLPPPLRLCAHCRRAPPRSGKQRYCPVCHAASTRAYRSRHEQELARLKRLAADSKPDDRFTRRAFERRFGKTRHVLVSGIKGTDELPVFEVLRFCPKKELELRSVETGELLSVSLNQVMRCNVRSEVQDPLRLCSHCKTAPVRKRGQHYCRGCHGASMRVYRRRKKQALARFKQVIHEMTIENSHTKAEFEKRFGTLRRVLVVKEVNSDWVIDCSGEVLRFLPGEKLEVRSETGELLILSLEDVRLDADYIDCPAEYDPFDYTQMARKEAAGSKRRREKFIPASAHTAAWSRKQREWEKVRRRRRV